MSQNVSSGAALPYKPPYFAYKTLKNYLDSFTNSESLPSHIERGVMPSTMSGGNQVAVINALKFLGLISSEGIPTANFYNLADAEGKERAKIWREILVNAYSFLLNDLDIERATSRLVVEKFRDADMSGDTIRKAIQFFLSAAKDVEMKVSPHVKATHTQSGARTRTPRARRTDGRTGDESPDDDGEDNNPPDPPPTAKSPYQVLIEILSPQMEEPEQDAVWTLIRYLKKQEAKGE